MDNTITKIKRGYWKLEGDGSYAVLALITDFDATETWKHGWHVKIRDCKTGAIITVGKCHATRASAEVEARVLIGLN